MNEIWKKLEGTDCLVSNLGNVVNKKGYVCFHVDNNAYRFRPWGVYGNKKAYIHRVVASLFVENPNGYTCVFHKDGDNFNNSADNLEWRKKEIPNKRTAQKANRKVQKQSGIYTEDELEFAQKGQQDKPLSLWGKLVNSVHEIWEDIKYMYWVARI